MSRTVKDKIIEQVERLSEPQQRQVLDFARRLGSPAGVAGKDLLRFVGSIETDDLDVISKAIMDDCEKVDLNGW